LRTSFDLDLLPLSVLFVAIFNDEKVHDTTHDLIRRMI
jgi:hypothetical protein